MRVNIHREITEMPDGELKPKITWDGSINLGTMIHLIILIVTIVLAWGQFDKRTTILEIEIQTVTKQQEASQQLINEAAVRTERIERYLISKDPKYLEQFGAPESTKPEP